MGKTEVRGAPARSNRAVRGGALAIVVCLVSLLPNATAQESVSQTDGPAFSAQVLPSTAPAGATATLQVRVDNSTNDSASRFSLFAELLPGGGVSDGCGFAQQVGDSFVDATIDAGEVCVLEYPFSDAGASGPRTYGIVVSNLGTEVWFTNSDGSAVTNPPNISLSATVTWIEYPPPSLALSFGSPTIETYRTTTLSYRFDNSAAPEPVLALSMASVLPAGLAFMPGAVQSTCGGVSRELGPGEALLLSGGQIPANGTCSVTVLIGASAPGTYDNLGDFDSLEVTYGEPLELLFDATVPVLVVLPPSTPIQPVQQLISAGAATPNPTGGDKRIARYELVNPNEADALGIDVDISATHQPMALSSDCDGTATVSHHAVVLAGIELAGGQRCTVEFTVTSIGRVTGRLYASAASRLLPIESPVLWDYSLGARCLGRRIDFDVQRGVPFVGTDDDDVVLGSSDADVIDVRGGDDRVCAGAGDDLVFGRGGSDMILGEDGRDKIYGGADIDMLNGGAQIDRLFGQGGDDVLVGEGGSDRIFGGTGNDLVRAGSGADRVFGGPGDDELLGMGGQDFMHGDDGDDQLQGNFQSDRLWGDAGDDVVRGAGGKDRLSGGPGNDELYGGTNTDFLDGGPGEDLADGQAGRDNPLVTDVSGCIAEVTISC